jgi:protein involved in polysaccharide export with SLBB domain
VNEAGGFQATSSLAAISLRRDGVEHLVTAAGPEFTGAAHDGDVVTIRPAPRVSVLGSVAKPGDTTLRVGSTVLSALYEAGGPSKNADLKHIKVVHDGAATSHDLTGLTRGDVSADMPVRDGDVIFVPQGRHFDPAVFFQALGALAPWWYGVVR